MPDANMRITYNFDTWDAATITSSTEASTELADDNVIDFTPSKRWKTTANTSNWIKFDLGSVVNLKTIGLFNFNWTSSAVVTLEAHASDSWGSPTYSQVLTVLTDSDSVVEKRIVFNLDQTFQWWRLTIEDSGNSDAFITLGIFKMGVFYEFVRNIKEGFGITPSDPSSISRTPGAYSQGQVKDRFRTANVMIPVIEDTQRDKLSAIFNKIGNNKPCILELDPTNRISEDSMYCRMTTPLPFINRTLNYYDVTQINFEELTR